MSLDSNNNSNNANNAGRRVNHFQKGRPITASNLNKLVDYVNQNARVTGEANQPLDNIPQPQLYVATEDKGKWTDNSTTRDNAVVNCRPIYMSQYQEDGTNDDILGEEVELTKFWDQEISTDDIGIGVDMGSGRIGFYAIKGGGTTGTVDPTPYEYGVACGVTLDTNTWKRNNPDTDNPNNSGTGSPVQGFQIRVLVRVCYDTTNGQLIYVYRDWTIDSAGALKEMSVEQSQNVFTASACS